MVGEEAAAADSRGVGHAVDEAGNTLKNKNTQDGYAYDSNTQFVVDLNAERSQQQQQAVRQRDNDVQDVQDIRGVGDLQGTTSANTSWRVPAPVPLSSASGV